MFPSSSLEIDSSNTNTGRAYHSQDNTITLSHLFNATSSINYRKPNIRKRIAFLTNNGILIISLVVTLWLLLGTLFFAYFDNFGLIGGFNYAVSLFATIGWEIGFSDTNDTSDIFSCIFVFGGVLLLSHISTFSLHISKIKSQMWYNIRRIKLDRLQLIQMNKSSHDWNGFYSNLGLLFLENRVSIVIWLLLIIYVIFGVAIVCISLHIDIVKGLFFVVSAISTSGMYHPTADGKQLFYVFTSVYALFGIIIGAIAIVQLTEWFSVELQKERLERALRKQTTKEEVHALSELGITHGSSISRQEYLLIIILREKLIDEYFINTTFRRFDDIQTSSNIGDNAILVNSDNDMTYSESTRLLD